VYNLSSQGYQDIYISKFNGTAVVGIQESINTNALSFQCFPNPNSGDFNIAAKEKMTLNLIDNLGQIIQSIELNQANNFQQSISILRSGIYFISGQSAKGPVKQKIIVTR
jgi:hypothetical protein